MRESARFIKCKDTNCRFGSESEVACRALELSSCLEEESQFRCGLSRIAYMRFEHRFSYVFGQLNASRYRKRTVQCVLI